MNAVHLNCNGTVYADISSVARILATFGIGTKSIKASLGYIKEPKKGQHNIKYFCSKCEKDVQPEEISIACGWCGNLKPSTELLIPLNSKGKAVGDIICKDCYETFNNIDRFSDVIELVKTLSKIYFDN